MKVGEIVGVVWVDSISPIDSPWHWCKDIKNELPEINSVGRVHAISKTALTLTASWSDADDGSDADHKQVGGVITIPRCAIVKEAVLMDLEELGLA